ncbi:Uncharacterised protein [uncultured Clostridium sp.]|nr:Uncharacterised protein [uncultured Clostridium sp.]
MKGIESRTEKTGLLLNIYDREPGEFTNAEGKLIKYEAATVIVLLLLWDSKGSAQKIKVDPSAAMNIKEQTEDLAWASLVKVKLNGKEAVSIELIQDPFSKFF